MVNPFKKKYAVVSVHPRFGELTTSRTFITRFYADKWARTMNDYVGSRFYLYRRAKLSWWVVKEL